MIRIDGILSVTYITQEKKLENRKYILSFVWGCNDNGFSAFYNVNN